MKAYSVDLRERVIRAVEADEARASVAARFEVSMPTIERWVRLKRETGGLARRRVPGARAVKTVGLSAALPGRLAGHADATLAEHCAWWREASGCEVSPATMCRALTRLGWTRKKRPSGRASATRRGGRPGAAR
jgi:transposase